MTQVKKKRNLVWLNKYIFKILICFTVLFLAQLSFYYQKVSGVLLPVWLSVCRKLFTFSTSSDTLHAQSPNLLI